MSLTGHEDEFRRLFEQEARTRLAALAEHTMELERRGPEPDLVAEMFRDAHTLKGGAAVVGLDDLAGVLHDVESALDELRQGRLAVSAPVIDAMLEVVDGLRALVSAAMRGDDSAPAAVAVRAALERVRGAPARPVPVVREEAPEPQAPADAPDAIPVPVQRLDELVRLVGESAGAQLRVGRLISERLGNDPGALDEYRDLARVLRDLQQQTMRTRMVSVATVAGPLRRSVRDMAREAGKRVRLELAGEATELDRHVLEQLREPLVALVRNAVAHGVETPEERRAAGKPAEGVVRLHAMQIGAEVVIVVGDDGRGIDVEAVGSQMGQAGATEDEALEAIFRPGLSTAAAVTGVAGRGVGLDAVRAAVDQLRGRIEVHSAVGEGTEFRIGVPMTLAVLGALVVEAAGRPVALPMHAVVGILSPAAEEVVSAEGRPAVWVGPDAVALSDLGTVVGGAPATAGPVVVVSTGGGRHAFRVQRIGGQREVVVKDLGRLLERLDLVAGASVEPDGSVMLVLDPAGLIERAQGRRPPVAALGEAAPEPAAAAQAPAPAGRVLVVDDALTIRELQRSILERAGFEVRTAADGAEAIQRLQEWPAELVLTDVEMPRMDGFELTEAIRARPESAAVAIVILTSRDHPADRRRGLEAGADAYIVKSAFDEHGLLQAVRGLLGEGSTGT